MAGFESVRDFYGILQADFPSERVPSSGHTSPREDYGSTGGIYRTTRSPSTDFIIGVFSVNLMR